MTPRHDLVGGRLVHAAGVVVAGPDAGDVPDGGMNIGAPDNGSMTLIHGQYRVAYFES